MDESQICNPFSDYLLDMLETPLPLKEDGTIAIKTRNEIKRTALPLLADSLKQFFPDAEIIFDGTSIFINYAVPPRGDNPALTFS